MITYFGYPIDLCDATSPHHSVVERVRTTLAAETVVYEPGSAWSLSIATSTAEDLDRISIINFESLDQADFMLALAPLGVPSVGIPIEVYHMLATLDRKVALWFGVDCIRGIGAMWTYLIREFPRQICVLPRDIQCDDITRVLEWAAK